MSVANLVRRFVSATALAALGLLGLSAGLTAPAQAQLNLVYVEGNVTTGSGNVIAGFSNDGTGNLTALSGSPYLTGGIGVTGVFSDIQFDSDGELVANKAGSLMFAVNGNSNTISAFTVNANGSLSAIGSPIASGGQDPVSLALRENAYSNGDSLMVAVNKASDPSQTGGIPNYTTFRVTTSGSVTMNAGSSLNLPSGSSPAQIMLRPGAPVQFFGIEFMSARVALYRANMAGKLGLVSSDTTPSAVLGGIVHPSRGAVYGGLPLVSQLSVNKYTSGGALSFLRTVPNKGALICWLAINPAGTRVYSGETGSGTISVYDTTNPGVPKQLQHFTLTPSGSLPAHLKLDPTGQFLYVVDRGGSLHVLNVAGDGTVTETHTAVNLGMPAGAIPMGIVTMSK
ncbi:MAG: lactonase family protein [Acidobacteriia bacterium]|nr:lactonase family protein [Terriglobia bacterium]